MNAKFEKWCTSHRDKHGLCFFTVKKPDGEEYVDQGTTDAWLGWNAAIDRIELTDSQIVTVAREMCRQQSIVCCTNFDDEWMVGGDAWLAYARTAADAVISALKEQAK